MEENVDKESSGVLKSSFNVDDHLKTLIEKNVEELAPKSQEMGDFTAPAVKTEYCEKEEVVEKKKKELVIPGPLERIPKELGGRYEEPRLVRQKTGGKAPLKHPIRGDPESLPIDFNQRGIEHYYTFRSSLDQIIQHRLEEAESIGQKPAPLTFDDIEMARKMALDGIEKAKKAAEAEENRDKKELKFAEEGKEFYGIDDELEADQPLLDVPTHLSFSDISISHRPTAIIGERRLKTHDDYPLFHVHSDFEFSEINSTPDTLNSVSSEAFFANDAGILKIRVEDRPGKDHRQKLAKKTLSPEAYSEWQRVNREYPRLRAKRRWPIVEKNTDFNLCKEFDFSKDSDFTGTTTASFSEVEMEKIRCKEERLQVLKARWDQMTKEEIEEEILKNREAWEVKNKEPLKPVMLPYLPRIPGMMDMEKEIMFMEKKPKKKTSRLRQKSPEAFRQICEEYDEQPEDMDELIMGFEDESDEEEDASETDRLCTVQDEAPEHFSMMENLLAFFSTSFASSDSEAPVLNAPVPEAQRNIAPAHIISMDSGYSELPDDDDDDDNPRPSFSTKNGSFFSKMSLNGYLALASILLIVGIIGSAQWSSGGGDMVMRFTRNAAKGPLTPLQIALAETSALSRLINSIYIQNELFNASGSISIDTILDESQPFHKISPDYLDFVYERTLAIRNVTEKDPKGLLAKLNQLAKWKPVEVKGNFSQDLNLMVMKEAAMETLMGKPFNVWSALIKIPAEADKPTKEEYDGAVSSFKALVETLNGEEIDQFYKINATAISDLYNRLDEFLKDFKQNQQFLKNLKADLKTLQSLPMSSLISDGRSQEMINFVRSLVAPKHTQMVQNPRALLAFPRGIKEIPKVFEDFKSPWIAKVLDPEKLLPSLKYVMELFQHQMHAEKDWDRFQKKVPEIIQKDLKLFDKFQKLNMIDENGEPVTLQFSVERLRQFLTELDAKVLKAENHFKPYDYLVDSIAHVINAHKNLTDAIDQIKGIAKMHFGDPDGYKDSDTPPKTVYKQWDDAATSISQIIGNAVKKYRVELASKAEGLGVELEKFKIHMEPFWNSINSTFNIIVVDAQNVLKYVEFLEPVKTRRKREVAAKNPYEDLQNAIRHLETTRETLEKVFTENEPPVLEHLNNSRQLAHQLGYSQRIMETLLNVDQNIQTFLLEGPPAVWNGGQDAYRRLAISKFPKFETATESGSLKEHAKIYKKLEAIKINTTIDTATWRKEILESQGSKPGSREKLLEALDNLDGLNYVSKRNEMGNPKEDLKFANLFFEKFYPRKEPEPEEIIPFDPTLILFFVAILTLPHICLSLSFYKYELYVRAYRGDYPTKPEGAKAPEAKAPVGEPNSIPQPSAKNPQRERLSGGQDKPAQNAPPPQPTQNAPAQDQAPVQKWEGKVEPGTVKIEKDQNGDTLIWDVPPEWPKDLDKNLPPEEEANLLWIPFRKYQNADLKQLSYGSDDLRSIGTNTISTQSDFSDLMGSTRSDYTIPDSDGEDARDLVEYTEFPEEAEMDWETFWDKYKYPWALRNRLRLQGYRDMTQLERQEIQDIQVIDAFNERRNASAKEAQKKEDEVVRQRWERFLQRAADEVLRRKVNQEEVCRLQMAKQELEQKLIEQEKASRNPFENVKKYIDESYITNPDKEMDICQIAFKSITQFDNFIRSVHQDRWDHIYRSQSYRYTNDWARVKMSKDDPDDCDFYDACYIFPWMSVFEKVINQYRNKLIAVSSPMFAPTIGVLWHWLFEHNVQYMVMLNQFIEKNIQTTEVWFPLRKGDIMHVRRNSHREYIIECTAVKQKFKMAGVQRTFQITLVLEGKKLLTKKMKLLHMLDWEQDSLPLEWQHYTRICERVNRESLKSPVAVMSKYGDGRAMTLILSLMAAILARLDDDVSVQAMAQGARTSKRMAITNVHQVYIWRMLHYELLFRWFKDVRSLRVNSLARLQCYQDVVVQLQIDMVHIESRLWEKYFELELERYKRMNFMVEYLRKMEEAKRYDMREQRKIQMLYDAREMSEKTDERSPYVSGEPIRRKPLREGDKPRDPNRPPRKHVQRIDFTPVENAYAKYGIDPLIAGYQLNGCYQWVKPSEQVKTIKEGVPVPEKWKYWYTKEQQKGIKMKTKFE